ncbi:MAG TPA: hypothetical protein VLA04_01070 [Verrucomicrobiae bacterium]|nr:hypothetical protein [Verrucomicrobiae bacterium]
MTKSEREIHNLKKQIDALSEKLQDLTSSAAEDIDEVVDSYMGNAREWASETAEKNRDKIRMAKEAAAKTNEFAHDNPWAIAALGMGVGVLVGLLTKKDR